MRIVLLLLLLAICASLCACRVPTRGELELLSAVSGAETRADVESRLGTVTGYQRDFIQPGVWSSKDYTQREVYTTPRGSLEVSYYGNYRFYLDPPEPPIKSLPTEEAQIEAWFKRIRIADDPRPENQVESMGIYHDDQLASMSSTERGVYLKVRFAKTRGQLESALGSEAKVVQTRFQSEWWGGYSLYQIYQVRDVYLMIDVWVPASQVRKRDSVRPGREHLSQLPQEKPRDPVTGMPKPHGPGIWNKRVLELAPSPKDEIDVVQNLLPDEYRNAAR